MTKPLCALAAVLALTPSLVERAPAQSPSRAPANLDQLMRGTLYPESNVIFAAQDTNPADIPHAKDPNMSTDLLTSSYGKWDAVENSALAIVEVASLLDIPGRKCANGVDVPVTDPNWTKWVQGLRDAGMAAYAAAKSKDQDKITDAAGVLTIACKNCHDRYREKRMDNRCK